MAIFIRNCSEGGESIMPTPGSGPALTSATFAPGLVIDLGSPEAASLTAVGGKGANLCRMIRGGLPVPPGFCVTTDAYAQVAQSTSIDFDSLSSASTDELQRLAGLARESFLAAPMPLDVAAAVIDAYVRLGEDTPVAVRSSATAEDLPTASFAGQQDTYLNMVGTSAVLDAVRRCWASLWTDRAVVYRATNDIDHGAVRLGVVVQQMVDAEIAGVMFTANPVTGRRHQAVIDASPGLGEAVVSGEVNPDHFVVDPGTGDIVEQRLGDKRFSVRSLPGGGVRQVESTSGAGQSCLTDDQVRSLAALGEKVEAYFGAPQDTEWAIDAHGRIWLTQARPITTLFPQPVNAQSPQIWPGEKATDVRAYFCFSVAQGLYRPLTPMGLAVFRLFASSAAAIMSVRVDDPVAGPPAYAEAAQRVFIDVTGTLHGRTGRALLPRVLDMMEARSGRILRSLVDGPHLPLTRPSRLSFLRRISRIAFRFGVPVQIMRALARPEATRARVERMGAELSGRLTPPATATAGERLDFVQRVLGSEAVPLLPRAIPPAAAGLAMLFVAGKLLGESAGPEELETVLRGLPHNVTTEMDLALWRLARMIRDDKNAALVMRGETPAELCRRFQEETLPEPAQRGITEFLSRYGHRAVAEIDIGMPRWSDDPTHILGVVANYLRLENRELAPDVVFARGAAEAEAAIETLASRARSRGRLRAWLVRFALRRARELAGIREMPKYYMVVVLAAARKELARIGAELAQRGKIEAAADIFFLDFSEVRAAIGGRDVRDRVAERRQAYEMELRRRHVPRVLLSDGTEPEAAMASTSDTSALAGTPASAGTVTGIARVIFDPVGAHLEPGEILVAPSTDPGWTPLFLTAGGLVMEMGGANSHGAVVAREYGIPAVVGVAGATSRIVTGQRITVDGAGGTISLPE
jgi:pyruvate,water dikinase